MISNFDFVSSILINVNILCFQVKFALELPGNVKQESPDRDLCVCPRDESGELSENCRCGVNLKTRPVPDISDDSEDSTGKYKDLN